MLPCIAPRYHPRHVFCTASSCSLRRLPHSLQLPALPAAWDSSKLLEGALPLALEDEAAQVKQSQAVLDVAVGAALSPRAPTSFLASGARGGGIRPPRAGECGGCVELPGRLGLWAWIPFHRRRRPWHLCRHFLAPHYRPPAGCGRSWRLQPSGGGSAWCRKNLHGACMHAIEYDGDNRRGHIFAA